MGNKLSFEKKLFKYSAAAGAVLGLVTPIQASVQVSNPNTPLAKGENLPINFDGAQGNDITIVNQAGTNIIKAEAGNSARVIGVTSSTGKYVNPRPLTQGEDVAITPAIGAWVINTNSSATVAFPGGWGLDGHTDRYLGVRFNSTDGLHYAWIQLNIGSSPYNSITVVSYAYETSPNTPINNPLPVELVSFNALQIDTAVKLLWTTATELNNYGFDIERAALDSETDIPGGDDWEKIGFVPGNGNSNSPKHYEFSDSDAPEAYLYYRLKQIDTDGSYEYFNTTVNIDNSYNVTAVKENGLPVEFVLEQNYPNPFNPNTRIKFSIAEKGFVKLSVFNSIGEKVAELVNGNFDAGNYEVEFNAGNTANGVNLPSGIYIYRLQSGDKYTSERKMALLK